MNSKKSPGKKTKSARGQSFWTIDVVIEAIQNSLTPDLLKRRFREGNATNPLFGHCYHSAGALFHLIRALRLPEKFLGYRSCRGVDDGNIPHYWLQNERGEILDPTVGQYTSKGLNPPYGSGRFKNFMTKQPSKISKIIIERIHSSINSPSI